MICYDTSTQRLQQDVTYGYETQKTTTTIWMRKATTTIWIIKAMVLVDSTSLETTRSQAILRPVSLSGPKPSSTFATAACIIQCAR